MSTIEDMLNSLEAGSHAVKSRDFGRGIAFAVKMIREAMEEPDDEAAKACDGPCCGGDL